MEFFSSIKIFIFLQMSQSSLNYTLSASYQSDIHIQSEHMGMSEWVLTSSSEGIQHLKILECEAWMEYKILLLFLENTHGVKLRSRNRFLLLLDTHLLICWSISFWRHTLKGTHAYHSFQHHKLNHTETFKTSHFIVSKCKNVFVFSIPPSVSLHFPPWGWQRIKEQPVQGTTVWAWLKIVVIL